jgi:hypothetical protein
MEGRRALWLQALLASAIVVVSLHGDAALGDGQPAGSGPPDTNMLCASKCGTCPTVCYSSPPPPSSSSDGGSNGPPAGTPGSGGGSSPSHSTPPQGQGQNKGGGHPSGYYYFFTSGGSGRRTRGPSGYALVPVTVVVALAAGFHK